jgi:hypothetical protein
MTTLQIFPTVLTLVAATILGVLPPQASQNADKTPMTKDEVIRLFKNLGKDALTQEVVRVGVDFELDPKTNQDFRELGMASGIVDLIGQNSRFTAVTVLCEPVDCEVTINNEPVGKTVSKALVHRVKPGQTTIKVSAPPSYEAQETQVTVPPWENVKVPKFTMPEVTGELAVSCQPVEVCGITVRRQNFSRSGQTSNHQFNVKGLPLGQYEVEVQASEYLTKKQTVQIANRVVQPLAVTLEPDLWGPLTPPQVLDKIVGSLGGKEIMNVKNLRNQARMRVVGDPTSIGNWNSVPVVEFVAPNRLRWEMVIAGSKWNVFYDGTKAGSKGDNKSSASGTEFGQELQHSIQLFSAMRLPLVLSTLTEKLTLRKAPGFVLIAESSDDRYTFQLNSDFSPQKLLHEHLTIPVSKEEMEFTQYKSIGPNLKLPHVLVLRYPDRPKHEHSLVYDKMETVAPIKEEQFKR